MAVHEAPAVFVALYRGRSVSEARLVGACSDPEAIQAVIRGISRETLGDRVSADPVIKAMHGGKRKALQVIRRELEEAAHEPA